MKDRHKSKEQLIKELAALREKVARMKELEVEHRLAMNELQKSEERFHQIFQTSPDYLLITRLRDGTVLHCNDSFLCTMGYARDEVIGKSTNDLGSWAVPADRRRFVRALLEHKRCNALETAFRTKDGRITPILISARLIELDGQICVISAISDITSQKVAEEALRKAAEEIKLFAYSVFHDLKSPAIGVYGLTKILHNHLQTTLDEKARNYCDQIVKAAEQIALLVERINLFISTKEVPLNIQSVRLVEILQILRSEFASQIIARQIRWLQPAHAPEINADRISLLRALRNLVDNALKYGGSELGEIEIGYLEDDQFHILSVRDDGIGMKMEDPAKIFGYFQRHETSRGVEGSGLGLAIVKEIAEQHGGKAWMEAVPGGGTIFHISISKKL